MKEILIAIPIYNEEKNLDKVFTPLFNNINKKEIDILAIDDGSTDDSLKRLRSYPEIKYIKNIKNFGYGFSLITVFKYAESLNYKYLITMDADGQHLPYSVKDFIDGAGDCDVLSGSRYLNMKPDSKNLIKERFEINNKVTALLNRITDFNLTDSFCGMKLYRVKILKYFNATDYLYAMPLQVILQAWHNNLTWKEIQVPLIYIDNQRNFNDLFESHDIRYNYYLKTIKNEMERLGYEKSFDIRTTP